MEDKGVLYETGSGKFLELIPGNARFHSSRENATPISKADFEDKGKLAQLLDHHNVDWYMKTIELRPLTIQPIALPEEAEFDLLFQVPSNGKDWQAHYDDVEAVILKTTFWDYTLLSGSTTDKDGGRFNLSVEMPGSDAEVLAKVMAELATLLPNMRILNIEFAHVDLGAKSNG